jgi:multidrug efflux pump subunit AcrB
LLNAALGEVRANLPADTKVDARLLTSGTFPILDISLSSRVRSLAELTDIAQYDLVPGLHRISGVYRVETVGAKYREYVVQLDPARLMLHKLTPQDVAIGLAKANVIESAGRVSDTHRMLLTVVTTDLHAAEQLAAVPVATLNGQPIYVRDVGSVKLAMVEDYIRTASERGPAVLVGVSQQPGGNTTFISRQTHAIIDDFRTRYPDVSFSFSYDQATLVQDSFNSVRDAIALGLILAVAVVCGFTRSPLSALIAALVVPCTILITFAIMSAIGMTFNMMTLGGLAAGIGLFIDDAIVMIEAIHRAHAGGTGIQAAVQNALGELTRPLIASTATVVVVFLPLVFLSGVTGVFFRALAFTLGSGLAVSLILALYFTPSLEMLVERWRGSGRDPGRLFVLIQRLYVLGLKPFLRLPVFAVMVAAGSLVLAVTLYRTIGTDYLPELDEGAFTLDYTTPPESTLDDTQGLLARIEDVLRSTPEVGAFSRRTGTQLGFFLTESNRGDISVLLKSKRTRGIDKIMDSIRARILGTVPGVRIEFSQVLQDLIGDLSGTPEPIEIKVFGADQATIEAVAGEIANRLRKIPGLVDTFDGLVLSNPEEEVLINQTAVERYGLTADDVRSALRTVVEGTVATELRVGDRLLDVRVRYPDRFHLNLYLLGQTLIDTPNGGRIPLSTLAALRFMGERTELDRERLRPVVHVTSRVEGTDLGTAMAQVKQQLQSLELPPGVTLEFGGLYAEQQKAFQQLELVLAAATVAMFLVLVWEFAAIKPALAVLIGALSCLAGSFLGLNLTAVTLNISSFMGIVMVAGITAKNGILLLDHAQHDIAKGIEPQLALVDAARIRLRPILMTTMATAAGLLPLALGLGAGAKVQQPLAIAVIGGLAYALILSTPLAAGIYLIGTRKQTGAPAEGTDQGIIL